MQLINKSQTQRNLDALEKRIEKATLALAQTANALNAAYDCVWSLPEDQLKDLLQYLLDNNRLEEVFSIHAQSAASINALLSAIGYSGAKAKDGAGRQYEIIDGIVSIIPLPELEEIYPTPTNNEQ